MSYVLTSVLISQQKYDDLMFGLTYDCCKHDEMLMGTSIWHAVQVLSVHSLHWWEESEIFMQQFYRQIQYFTVCRCLCDMRIEYIYLDTAVYVITLLLR